MDKKITDKIGLTGNEVTEFQLGRKKTDDDTPFNSLFKEVTTKGGTVRMVEPINMNKLNESPRTDILTKEQIKKIFEAGKKQGLVIFESELTMCKCRKERIIPYDIQEYCENSHWMKTTDAEIDVVIKKVVNNL